jgi:hypothetical protein
MILPDSVYLQGEMAPAACGSESLPEPKIKNPVGVILLPKLVLNNCFLTGRLTVTNSSPEAPLLANGRRRGKLLDLKGFEP